MGKRSSLMSLVTTEYKKLQEERHRPSYPLAVFESDQSANFPYPIDMSLLLDLPYGESRRQWGALQLTQWRV